MWPPPIEEEKVPIAAPLYKPVPETLHVTVKPCVYRPLQPRQPPPPRLSTQNVRKVETQHKSREPLEIENCFLNVESNITATTSTSNASSESEYKMYQTQNNHYANMFEQHQTNEVDDEVESINTKVIIDLRKTPPPIELPKDIKIVDFVEPPANYIAETFTSVFSNRKEKWMTITESSAEVKKTVKKEVKISDKEPETIEDPEENDVEEEIKGQHVGPYDGTYYQLPPSNIPQPTPKGYQSGLQKALIYSSDKPYHMRDMLPTPEPQFPQMDVFEKAVKEVETQPSPPKEEKIEKPKFEIRTTAEQRDFPHDEKVPRQGNSLFSSMMRTASPRPMEFLKSNVIEEVEFPIEMETYLPPPISMVPNEPYPSIDSYRTKSPFVSALTTIPDRPFTPFGREIMSQLSLDLQRDMQKGTLSNALHTAPDESFDPSSLEYEYVESNVAPVEYTAKVYERIAVETDGVEEEHAIGYGRVTPMSRAYMTSIQPWSTPSEQVPENSFKDTMSSGRESMECSVTESRRASEIPNVASRRESAAVCERVAVCEPKCCCKKNIADLLKEPKKEEEVFDPEIPNENAPYPKQQHASQFEGMQVKVTNKMTSSLHKPDEIPTYQRKWFNLPTQNPPQTPEPEELKENVPVAFKEWSRHEEVTTTSKPPIPHETTHRVSISEKAIFMQESHCSSFSEKQETIHRGSVSSSKQPIAQETHRGSVSEKVQIIEDDDYKFPTRRPSQSTGLFPTRSIFEKDEIELFLEREAEEEKTDVKFPVSKKGPSESSFPIKDVRRNSVLDLPQKQQASFERVKSLKHELEAQHQKMQNKSKLRQQKELQSMYHQRNMSRTTHETIKEEIEQNQELSSYQMEQEYKRQLELEKEQREKEKALKEQQFREQEYQRQMEEARLHDIKMKEKREREYQMELQRDMEYRKQREAQEEMARINQEERDRVLRRQQEEIEKEILRQQEQEKREAEERETRRQLEIRRKEERDRELARIEEELRQKREEELKRLEEEIRMKREQRLKEEQESFNEDKKRREKERKERELAEKEAKRLEKEAMDAQRAREKELQAELKLRQKQEADRKQREEMELFNIEEERKRNEEIAKKSKAYQASTFQQQMVWPPSNSSTPLPTQQNRQIPLIQTDSEMELNPNKFHFEPLDEDQKRVMAAIRPPSTCYSPPTDDKPFPSIPYYQQHLAFFETKPEHEGVFDPRCASPAIRTLNRCRSPAFGPPPNPLKAYVNKQRDPELDESGIYLCGERLLSPVWYDKQQKKIPPGVQRRLPIPGATVASKVHKQEAGTKPPPTPPPMPKPTKKICFAPDEKEATAVVSDLPPKGIVASQIRRLSGDITNSFSMFPIRSSFPQSEKDSSPIVVRHDYSDDNRTTMRHLTTSSFHNINNNQNHLIVNNSHHFHHNNDHFIGQLSSASSAAAKSSQNYYSQKITVSENKNSVDNVRVSTGSVGTPGAVAKHGRSFTTSGPTRGQGVLTQPATGRVPICGSCANQIRCGVFLGCRFYVVVCFFEFCIL